METIIIIGKQSSGKRTLANHIAFSLGYEHIYKIAQTTETDLFAVTDSYYYKEVQSEVFDEEMQETRTQTTIEKQQVGTYGFDKSRFTNGKYVITAMPIQLESIFEQLGRANCKVIYINIYNMLERKHRAVGEGDFRGLAFWQRDNDEESEFEDVQSDFEIDNKSLDTSKMITQIKNWLAE